MSDYVNRMLESQFQAALGMLQQCVERCLEEHWEGRIANGTFRWVAYHTLFFTDYYLSPSETAFELRELNYRGGDERLDEPAAGLSKEDALAYVAICRQKVAEILAGETREVLEGPSGFQRRRFSRGELHVYNIRHVQHHAGQMSAYLRRVDASIQHDELRWIGAG
jgi:hypothetical protein